MRILKRATMMVGAMLLAAGSAKAQTLTLEDAVAKAVAATPLVRAGEARIAAARAGRRQADVRPNPSVTVEGENPNAFGVVSPTGAV